MNQSKAQSIWFGIIATCLFLVGCRNARESVAGGATATTLSPVMASYGAAPGLNNSGQSSLIAVDAEAGTFSEEITYQEMVALSRVHDVSGLRTTPRWRYMGTKQEYHFLAYDPPHAGLRKVYRIHQSQYEIAETFDLRADSSAWWPLNPAASDAQDKDQPFELRPWLTPFYLRTNDFSIDLEPHDH
ncbi:MAG: hypothetical protein IH623_24875 [Verrucomicrobia bacterium]|nr:hypothetical protein [Verrucomicrobiota bacterium]